MGFDIASQGAAPADYLAAAAEMLGTVKQRSYELMRIGPGHRVIDVGCGPGLDTVKLAQRVGSEGWVVGVDRDQESLRAARQRAAAAGLDQRIAHQPAEAHALPFPPGTFHSARCERMLMHLRAPQPALREMARVLKPGGWLVLTEPDWGTLSIATTLTTIERRLAEIRADHTLPNGYAGRRLYQWLREHEFRRIEVDVAAIWSARLAEIRYLTFLDNVEAQALDLGFVSEHEIALWREDLETLDRAGHSFATMNLVTVAGRKELA